jgi:hypothetical protein
MTAEERIVIRAMTLLVIDWQYPEERATLLALVEEALPKVPLQGKAARLAGAAQQMLAATTPGDRTRAVTDAARVLAGILRSDLSAALTGQVADTLRMPA